jgi:hypothetical protein
MNRKIFCRAFALIIAMMLNFSLMLSAQPPSASEGVGTLAYHLATNAVGYSTGRSGTWNDMIVLSNWSYASYSATNLHFLTNSVWSKSFWLHDVKGLSATAIGYSNGVGAQTLLTMVSPRHYLFASHTHPEDALVAFLDSNNVIYWRRTLQRVDITNADAPDTSVGMLNADLPSSVGYLPVLPADYSNYLATNRTVIQGIGMNQYMRIFSQPMSFAKPGMVRWINTVIIPSGLGTNWGVKLVGGDSSNPEMLLIKNQLVLVSHNWAINAGPNYAYQTAAINRAMHYLSTHNHLKTDYQLTPFSLGDWPAIQ